MNVKKKFESSFESLVAVFFFFIIKLLPSSSFLSLSLLSNYFAIRSISTFVCIQL